MRITRYDPSSGRHYHAAIPQSQELQQNLRLYLLYLSEEFLQYVLRDMEMQASGKELRFDPYDRFLQLLVFQDRLTSAEGLEGVRDYFAPDYSNAQ